MSYRYYRLANTSANRNSTTTTRLHQESRVNDERLQVSGVDPILSLDFLSHLVEKADPLDMKER